MATDVSKLTATEQIEVMKSLSQQAAGWLIGVTSRSLRDHPELPRNADGTYNAKELAAAPIASRTLPEESADEVEKVLQIGEWLGMTSTLDRDGSLLDSHQPDGITPRATRQRRPGVVRLDTA